MLQVQLEYEHTTCDLCKHKFSCDIDSEIPEIRRHLPILSSGNRCTDYMCLGCVEVLLEKSPPRNKTWVACPWCRESKAFSPSNLKYHTMLIGLLQKARDPLFDEAIKAESEDVNEIETNLKGNSVEKNTMSIKVEDSAHDGKNSDSNDEIEVYYSKDIKRNKLNHQLAQKKKARHCMVKGEDEDETLKNIRNDMQDSYNIELARYHSIIDQEIPKKKRTRTEPIRLIETQSQKVVGDSQTARMHALQNGTQYERTFSSSLPNNSSLEFSDDEDSSNDENGDFQSSDDKAKPKFDDSSSDIDSSNSEASPRFDSSSSSDDEGMENSRSNGFSSDIQSSDDEDSCEDSEVSNDSSDKKERVQASDMNMKRPSQDYIENFIDEAFAKPKRVRKAPPRFIEEQTLGGYCSPKASTNMENTRQIGKTFHGSAELKMRSKCDENYSE
ncbi:hypothetical protein CTEN210_07885 [Chaetoceros tenuissimus]|uniref:Uncharacterized protein n=1 Tax=Chaetoceros tenuissimus TaxID=426638 RepID=A0AAD3H667_9STRA|nr:hypothetical protein CTEN210_07885 [Chaetoceros tenuissimus]